MSERGETYKINVRYLKKKQRCLEMFCLQFLCTVLKLARDDWIVVTTYQLVLIIQLIWKDFHYKLFKSWSYSEHF